MMLSLNYSLSDTCKHLTALLIFVSQSCPCASSEIFFKEVNITDALALKLVLKYDDVYLDSLSTLTDALAEVLSRTRNKLSLKGLASITNKQAEILASSAADIYLGSKKGFDNQHFILLKDRVSATAFVGLKAVGSDQIKILSKFRRLILDDVTSISAEDCLTFAKSDSLGQLSLNGLTNISDNALLNLCKGDYSLSIGGFQTLTDRQAGILGDFAHDLRLHSLVTASDLHFGMIIKNKKNIAFGALKKLSEKQEVMIAEHDTPVNVPALETITANYAKISMKKKLNAVAFDALEHMTDEVADSIGASVNAYVSLNKIKTLSAKHAEYLARNTGILELNGLEKSDSSALYELSRFRGTLELNGLRTIDERAAIALGRHIGDLTINGIKTIGIKESLFLSRHIGGIYFNNLTEIQCDQARNLMGMLPAELDPPVISVLYLRSPLILANVLCKSCLDNSPYGNFPEIGLQFNMLNYINEESIRYLGLSRFDLAFDGLKVVSDDQIRNLTIRPRRISLNGISAISDSQAACFGRHIGDLSLDGLESLSDRQALFLSLHKGGLSLKSLTKVSDLTARYLALNDTYLVLSGVSFLTEQQAINICKTKHFIQLGLLVGISEETKKILEDCPKVAFSVR